MVWGTKSAHTMSSVHDEPKHAVRVLEINAIKQVQHVVLRPASSSAAPTCVHRAVAVLVREPRGLIILTTLRCEAIPYGPLGGISATTVRACPDPWPFVVQRCNMIAVLFSSTR